MPGLSIDSASQTQMVYKRDGAFAVSAGQVITLADVPVQGRRIMKMEQRREGGLNR